MAPSRPASRKEGPIISSLPTGISFLELLKEDGTPTATATRCPATTLGNVTIGGNVHIGPNAVVTRDVPADTIVVVDPPRMLPRSPN
ncbi:MAG: hypothetical protein AB7H43_01110 [Acidimicrobiia bacterium]